MRRYMEMDGHSDARATYAAKVLLGSKRELYDSLPLGTMYADPWVIASAQSRAAQRFSHQAGTIGVGDEFDEDATLPTPSLEGQGVVIDDESSTLSDTLPGDVRWDRFANEPWRRYRWRSDSRDSNKIAEWRTAVGLALWRRGVVMDYGVGFMGFANDLVAVENVLGTPVAFLADHARVTTEAANLAALRLAGS
jgi:hypothetical protein